MLEIRPLAPEIGAEVTGFDMGKPLTDELFEDIHAAWMRHMVLVFPDQPVSDEALLAFGRCFGELEVFHQDIIRSKRLPEIFRVSNVDEDGNLMAPDDPVQHQISLARRWHTDSSYREKPSVGSLLHGVEVTEEGGETMFANMAAVLRALPADLRREVEGRRARHDFENLHRLKPLKPLTDEERARMPPVWAAHGPPPPGDGPGLALYQPDLQRCRGGHGPGRRGGAGRAAGGVHRRRALHLPPPLAAA